MFGLVQTTSVTEATNVLFRRISKNEKMEAYIRGAYRWWPAIWGPTVSRPADLGTGDALTCLGAYSWGPNVWGLQFLGLPIWELVCHSPVPAEKL